jgi:hypothetical protein
MNSETKTKFEAVLTKICQHLFSKTSFDNFPSKLRHFAKRIQEFMLQVPKFEQEKYRKHAVLGAVIARLLRNGMSDPESWGLVTEETFYRESSVKQNLGYVIQMIEVFFFIFW